MVLATLPPDIPRKRFGFGKAYRHAISSAHTSTLFSSTAAFPLRLEVKQFQKMSLLTQITLVRLDTQRSMTATEAIPAEPTSRYLPSQ